jgi:hypothetical protein
MPGIERKVVILQDRDVRLLREIGVMRVIDREQARGRVRINHPRQHPPPFADRCRFSTQVLLGDCRRGAQGTVCAFAARLRSRGGSRPRSQADP